jgi:hypothetical protein
VTLEHTARRPLLHTRWITTKDIIRFAAVAILVRLALAEQTYGSVGLLTAGGLTTTSCGSSSAWSSLAMAAGLVTAILALTPARVCPG